MMGVCTKMTVYIVAKEQEEGCPVVLDIFKNQNKAEKYIEKQDEKGLIIKEVDNDWLHMIY